jgi:hypothetical protein
VHTNPGPFAVPFCVGGFGLMGDGDGVVAGAAAGCDGAGWKPGGGAGGVDGWADGDGAGAGGADGGGATGLVGFAEGDADGAACGCGGGVLKQPAATRSDRTVQRALLMATG